MTYTVSDIRRHYNPKTDDECLVLKRVFRPLSFYLTWLYLKAGIRQPNWINLIGLLNGLAALAVMAWGPWYAGVGLYCLYLLHDQVDGNMARAVGCTSYRGKWMDGAIDVLVDGLLPVVIFQDWNGVGLSILFFYAFFLLNRFSFFAAWTEQGPKREHYNPFNSHFLVTSRNFEMNLRVLLFMAGIVSYKFTDIWYGILWWWLAILITSLIIQSERFEIHKQSRMGR